MGKKKEYIELLSDQALTSADGDKFDRKQFVDSIAEVIQSQTTDVNPQGDKEFKNLEENMIVGLYGSWGSGKSSIINMLAENLSDRSVESVYFNPWMYENEDQLLVSLFGTITSKMGLAEEPRKKLVGLIQNYLPLVSAFNPKAAEITEALLTSPNINAFYCKSEINKILLEAANPLVIFIDDIDRLSKHEIQTLFKTMRLIASFNKVIYVVACDFDMVAKSIKENYVGGNVEDGRSFLDKIIQIPIRIPEIKPEILFEYAALQIKRTLDVDVSSHHLFREMFEAYFHTPRDVKRFINGFRFTQNYISNVIDPFDLLLLELIRMKVFELYELIRIYYQSMKHLNTLYHYNKRSSEYIQKNKQDFYGLDSKINGEHREFILYSKFFKEVFALPSIFHLMFQTTPNGGQIKYDNYVRDQNVMSNKSLKNPKNLIIYFERLEVIKD
jgi:predicted KAP-like P-loop ATPase